MSARVVVPNDDTGRWEVHEPRGVHLAEFDSESLAREFAVAPELAAALRLVLNVADTAASVLRTISPDEAKRFRNDSKIIRAALAKVTP